MDGKSFLGTALFLHSNGSKEADFRSAISRAYYACFIDARDIAFGACNAKVRQAAGLYKQRNILHKPLQQYLKSGTSEEVRQLGEDLAALHGSRTDADYDMLTKVGPEDARQCIEEADQLLKALAGTPPAEIAKAMEDYISRIHRTGSDK